MSVDHLVCSKEPIERKSARDLSDNEFLENYFRKACPVVIEGATETWNARKWTIESLKDRIGDRMVWVRGETNKVEYQLGKKYTIRKDSFRTYCSDILANNARSKRSYLAVASIKQFFPELMDDLPFPSYMTANGRLHLGPYLWMARSDHYEFCHFDPDDNFLIMIQGRKRVLLFGHDLDNLYPNKLGSHGKTIQSQVHCDSPDLEKFPNFVKSHCQYTVLHPGEILFIPAFYWHQVSALDTGISVNIFYGNSGDHEYLEKILANPYYPHFRYWLLNIVEQNRKCESFSRMLSRLPEVLYHFFLKQFHEQADVDQIRRVEKIVMEYLDMKELPEIQDSSKFPPVLKIRGLLHRDDTA